jgi:protein involved in polysaccharide export with SLBB domain
MHCRDRGIEAEMKRFKEREMKTLISYCWAKFAVALLLVAVMGCSGMQPAVTAGQMIAESPPPETLQPGDVVDVKFFTTPELNESQIVRPDYSISLQLVGKVNVKGKTPEALRQGLFKLFAPQLKNPDVTVILRKKDDRRVFVTGEVTTPGMLEMPGDLTALEAIARAGGFKIPNADIRNVLVVRHKDGKNYGCVIDLKKVFTGQEEQVFALQPRDVIYVPPTAITKTNNWVDQYINKMIPHPPVGIGYTF